MKFKKNSEVVKSPTTKPTYFSELFSRKFRNGDPVNPLPFDPTKERSVKKFILDHWESGYYNVYKFGGDNPSCEHFLGHESYPRVKRWRKRWVGVDVSDVPDWKVKDKYLG